MTSGNYAETAINWYLSIAGVMVPAEQYRARLEVCKVCPKFGLVDLPGLKLLGCTECGCPATTKPKVLKYFSPSELRIKYAVCPRGLWAPVDSEFTK